MISTRSGALVIDTVVCLTLAKWETVSGRFGGYLRRHLSQIGATGTPHGRRAGSRSLGTLPEQG
jgi:hypothetical protein